jgi:hypothetical protein
MLYFSSEPGILPALAGGTAMKSLEILRFIPLRDVCVSAEPRRGPSDYAIPASCKLQAHYRVKVQFPAGTVFTILMCEDCLTSFTAEHGPAIVQVEAL